jgi:hypothetical protein
MELQVRTYAHKHLNKLGYDVINLSNGAFIIRPSEMVNKEGGYHANIELTNEQIAQFAIKHLESELSEQSKGHPDMTKIRSAIDEVNKDYKILKSAIDNMSADLDSAEFCLNGNSIEVESIDLDSADAEDYLENLKISLDNLYEITKTH